MLPFHFWHISHWAPGCSSLHPSRCEQAKVARPTSEALFPGHDGYYIYEEFPGIIDILTMREAQHWRRTFPPLQFLIPLPAALPRYDDPPWAASWPDSDSQMGVGGVGSNHWSLFHIVSCYTSIYKGMIPHSWSFIEVWFNLLAMVQHFQRTNGPPSRCTRRKCLQRDSFEGRWDVVVRVNQFLLVL